MFFKKDPEKERLKQERKQKELELKEKKKQEKELSKLKYKEASIENSRRKKEFKKTKSFIYITVDEISEMFKLNNDFFKVFKFDELVDYKLIEDGDKVAQGGVSVGRVAAGGLLLGPTGMLIGGLTGKKKLENQVTELKIEITVTGNNEGTYSINLIDKPVKKDSWTYKGSVGEAKRIIEFFDKISNVE